MLKLFKTETYRVYESLYKFLIMHMEFCSNIISNQNIRSILLQYYKDNYKLELDVDYKTLYEDNNNVPNDYQEKIRKELVRCAK